MPGEFRVKESCAPCKKRKSKCDAQQPCASCILRNSQDRCQYAHGPPTNATPSSGLGPDRRSSAGDHRSSPYPIRPAEMAETSSAPTKRAMTEIMKLKTSIHHLEGHVRELSRLENGLHMEEEPATTKEKDNWKTVLGVIPGKAIVEVLLEYNIQECGWLWQCGDIVSIWERAIRRGGVSASEAGLMCLSLALPSYVLGASQAPLYRLPINTDRLHNDLFDVSRHFATSDPQTLDDLAHYCALIEYQVFSGRHNPFLLACAQAAARAIRDLGYIDEGRPVWATLDTATRERARDIVRRIVSNYRWAILTESTQDVLHNCRVNLCDPSENLPSLKGPIDLALPGDPDLEFRIFRPISRAEQQQGLAFVKLFVSIDRVTPDIRAYKLRLSHGYPTEMEKADLVSRCQSIYTTLLDLRDREAVQAGFGDADIHSFDLSIPTQARKAAMILLLHNAIEFLMTTVTRHWLTNNHPSNAAEQTLHDVCLQTATRAMQWMDVSKSLVTMKNAPFVPAFASANLFNAAIAFTVPVLRAVKLWTTTDRDGDIKDLPSIPDNSHHHVPTADNTVSLGDMSATRSLPATIYIDGAIRSYANNILLILDTLKALSVSPLGEETEKRLEMLIQRYGLSDSRDWDMPIQQPPPLPDMSWNGNTMTTWTTPPEGEAVDPNVLNQLLLLDPSIWQGIMNQPMGGQ